VGGVPNRIDVDRSLRSWNIKKHQRFEVSDQPLSLSGMVSLNSALWYEYFFNSLVLAAKKEIGVSLTLAGKRGTGKDAYAT